MDLTIQNKVKAEASEIRVKAKQDAEAEAKLPLIEKEEQIASMQKQIEELKRKAEQGSQQLQGEAQELQFEALLRAKFTRDVIEPVPKGEFGGDILQRVMGPGDQPCGSILWESKRTKNFSDGWLERESRVLEWLTEVVVWKARYSVPTGIKFAGHFFHPLDNVTLDSARKCRQIIDEVIKRAKRQMPRRSRRMKYDVLVLLDENG
jgi:hypothetical protein